MWQTAVIFCVVCCLASARHPPIRDRCTGVRCEIAKCVDPVKEDGECCERCPEGDNCWMGNEIIAAQQEVMRKSGDARCPINCRCPDSLAYREKGIQTTAVCKYTCNGYELDVDVGVPPPGLGKKRESPERREVEQEFNPFKLFGY
ncbi:hypothetical protein CAPTEDRAFT_225668 [Capitella teleta]|uniref:VWFC domain-containing protein n=1 Tax=Capitella teleta TaxID=283909 RepID=R7UFE1_CAPTE|nr:hypothetical protein CAPTEDRAFT_225668 [Capitella teleta]|eukprot:ELU05259.1 hypothetical protein CAPTEDRAFT_225668 [Capitella teleta]